MLAGTVQSREGTLYVPGVVFGGTVIVPSGFIPTAPALGAGGVPGVSVTLVSSTAYTPLA